MGEKVHKGITWVCLIWELEKVNEIVVRFTTARQPLVSSSITMSSTSQDSYEPNSRHANAGVCVLGFFSLLFIKRVPKFELPYWSLVQQKSLRLEAKKLQNMMNYNNNISNEVLRISLQKQSEDHIEKNKDKWSMQKATFSKGLYNLSFLVIQKKY